MKRLTSDERVAIIGITAGISLILCGAKPDGVAVVVSCVGYLIGSRARTLDIIKRKEGDTDD